MVFHQPSEPRVEFGEDAFAFVLAVVVVIGWALVSPLGVTGIYLYDHTRPSWTKAFHVWFVEMAPWRD